MNPLIIKTKPEIITKVITEIIDRKVDTEVNPDPGDLKTEVNQDLNPENIMTETEKEDLTLHINVINLIYRIVILVKNLRN